MKTQLTRILLIFTLILVNIGCDQSSKSLVRSHVEYNERIELLGDHVILTKVENKGAFLSLGSSLPDHYRKPLFSLLPALIMVGAIAFLLLRTDVNRWFVFGLSCIVGGGIGNLIDRVMYDSVTDFLNMGIGDLRTGIFNFADVSIMVGMFIVLFAARNEKSKDTPPAETA